MSVQGAGMGPDADVFNTIVESLDEGIVTVDANGLVTFLNHAAERILGWKKEELQGRNFIEMVPMVTPSGRLVAVAERPLGRVLRGGEITKLRALYRRKDGSTIAVAVTGTPLKAGKEAGGAIGTLRDISDEEAVIRAKSEFVTLASHQLRTPISAISWISELLLSGDTSQLTSEQHQHITDIYESNKRMAALVSEMLIVSSVELQALPVRPEKTDIVAEISGVLNDVRRTFSSDNHIVHENYSKVPDVACDPEILTLLLKNLLTNAFKYTPKGGAITVTVAKSADKIRPNSQGSVVVSVADTGYGIPGSAANKIFTKFFRADNIKHKDTDGTGLGLYVVKAVLDYVGGAVDFTSTEGKGATFTLRLPLEGMAERKGDGKKIAWEVA
jgi:PAS domain S-box-containing protein